MAVIKKENIFDSKDTLESIKAIQRRLGDYSSIFKKKQCFVEGGEYIIPKRTLIKNKNICEYCGNHNKNENQTCYSCGANLK